MTARTVLVLGGGIGGVATARALRRRLPRPHRIVLVDREREHPSAHRPTAPPDRGRSRGARGTRWRDR
ncbi:MAG: NAD(P)-binding protein [Acidobacteria bacterium]|nr:NAD(P)-binding protein [Acidobacteriota bacterium]